MNSADPEHDVFDDDRDDDPDAVSYNLVGHIHPSDRYHSQRYATSVRSIVPAPIIHLVFPASFLLFHVACVHRPHLVLRIVSRRRERGETGKTRVERGETDEKRTAMRGVDARGETRARGVAKRRSTTRRSKNFHLRVAQSARGKHDE